MDRKELKGRAKAQLGGSIFSPNWLYAILVIVIFMALTSAISAIPVVGALIVIIFSGALEMGFAYIFLKQARDGKKMEIGSLFKGFSDDIGGNIVLGLLVALFTFLWSLLFIVPGIIKAYAYSMAFYVKSDHPDYGWKECIDESQRIMNGHKMDLFVLHLSFIGWSIVGSLCFGIGTLWVQAYISATTAHFYESIKDCGVVMIDAEA